MAYLLIGLLIGLMMGITGAGGAIISIPLFQLAMGSSLKEATVLSLITVIFGTAANLFNRLGEVSWKIVFTFTFAGTVANFLAHPLKDQIPELVITILLVLIGAYSITSVLRSPVATRKEVNNPNFLLTIFIGLFLGLVTTFTGLGGGVLLIPLLLSVFGMSYEKALPTSLASIFLISSSALVIQGEKVLKLITAGEVLFIAIGAIVAFILLKLGLKSVSEAGTLKLRKLVFTIATIISLVIVVLKTF